ncbi:MAG: hypothetical protein ACI8Y4_004535 [Candidatus Poriferisodalaceae bacterium]|jgi:hypothetical protein
MSLPRKTEVLATSGTWASAWLIPAGLIASGQMLLGVLREVSGHRPVVNSGGVAGRGSLTRSVEVPLCKPSAAGASRPLGVPCVAFRMGRTVIMLPVRDLVGFVEAAGQPGLQARSRRSMPITPSQAMTARAIIRMANWEPSIPLEMAGLLA